MVECFCCFQHPRFHEKTNSLSDNCSECGLPYGFPLDKAPAKVGTYKVVRPISRGFYGATYLVEKPQFNAKAVVKLVPKVVYSFFNKDFEKECKLHHALAEDCDHVVAINAYGSEKVFFGTLELDCHFAELAFVPGNTLRTYLETEEIPSARFVAQVALDTYCLLGELATRHVYHNDLHAANLMVQALPDSSRRVNAIDDGIRVVAIDLGSISDQSSSDPEELRLGDVGWASRHISTLANRLLARKSISDQDYRLSSLLSEHCALLSASSVNQRVPTYRELCEQVNRVIADRIFKPWKADLSLSRLQDGYNAQTISSWHVPSLIVDPNEEWLKRLTARGPTILTGMRGCGKTMVLRSADFHARVSARSKDETDSEKLRRVAEDRYIGFYASATRLLGRNESSFEKLYVAFARSVSTALEHLADLDRATVNQKWREELLDTVATALGLPKESQGVTTSSGLDAWLLRIHIKLEKDGSETKLIGHPSEAFARLADFVRRSSTSLASHYVLFLLDDVSTRYHSEDSVKNIVSELLFQNDSCAFKFTTEAQTLELVLYAPGQQSQAWRGRDYVIFDLGREVSEQIAKRGSTIQANFLRKILYTRGQYLADQITADPKVVLGNRSMTEIARQIAKSKKNSKARKNVYSGLSALAGVCVGDVGDVISLYDEMLRKNGNNAYPISNEIQSDSFQAFCSKKLFELSRRETTLKDFGLTFAGASHELLIQSVRKGENSRIRQYTTLYVSVTTGDTTFQLKKLRELVDAGVFVLDGGTDAPRSKTRDSDPLTQFKLRFRKVLGLSSYMPLADRDRFELSGDQLEKWLNEPQNGEAILMNNLYSEKHAEKSDGAEEDGDSVEEEQTLDLFSDVPIGKVAPEVAATEVPKPYETKQMLPTMELVDDNVAFAQTKCIAVGLGFEQRTLESLRHSLRLSKPEAIIGFRFPEPGLSAEMIQLAKDASCRFIETKDELEFEQMFVDLEGDPILDISGLTTSLIFKIIRSRLLKRNALKLQISYPQTEYPSDEDIQKVFNDNSDDPAGKINAFRNIYSGELGPYALESLLPGIGDPLKERILCAFASSKHERLFCLLDQREFDQICIAFPPGNKPTERLAHLAAEVAEKNYQGASLTGISLEDPVNLIKWLVNKQEDYFLQNGANVEWALTGSKLQTAAAAAASCTIRLTNAWYVKPSSFDVKRFTHGYIKSQVWEIKTFKHALQ